MRFIFAAMLLALMASNVLAAGSEKSIDVKPEARILWLDSSANLYRLSTRAGVRRILDNAQKAGINMVMVNTRNSSGSVMYLSKIAPHIIAPIGYDRNYDKQPWTYPADYDLLQTVIEEGHQRGMSVYADLWTFGAGIVRNGKGFGPVFTDHPEWATTAYDSIQVDGKYQEPRIYPVTQDKRVTGVMVNQVNPEYQRYMLSIIDELVQNYQLDGINLDGCRFNNFSTDFSDLTRTEFEKYIGHRVERWPQDVYEIKIVNNEKQIIRGPLCPQWDLFRARVIRDFVMKASHLIHSRKSDVKFGAYVGSWYTAYEDSGVNWGSKDYIPNKESWADWVPEGYNETGYLEFLDYLCTGNYYKNVAISELAPGRSPWVSVEGACELVNKVTLQKVPIYGTLYLLDYDKNPEQLRKAIQMCRDKSNGVALFDLCYLELWNWWPEVQGFMDGKARPPHELVPSTRNH